MASSRAIPCRAPAIRAASTAGAGAGVRRPGCAGGRSEGTVALLTGGITQRRPDALEAVDLLPLLVQSLLGDFGNHETEPGFAKDLVDRESPDLLGRALGAAAVVVTGKQELPGRGVELVSRRLGASRSN